MSYEWVLEVLLIKLNANEMLLQGLYHMAQSYFKAGTSSSGLSFCVCVCVCVYPNILNAVYSSPYSCL